MRLARGVGAAILVLSGLSAGARGAPMVTQPFVTPQHDVDVVYAMLPDEAGGGADATQRLRWSVALQAQRIDVPGAPTYVVTRHREHLTAAIRLDGRGVIEQAAPEAVPAPGQAASGGYTRLAGPAQDIAGRSCSEWQVSDASGQSTVLCLTDDGVMLRVRQGGRVLLLARSVSEATQPEALFVIPKTAAAP